VASQTISKTIVQARLSPSGLSLSGLCAAGDGARLACWAHYRSQNLLARTRRVHWHLPTMPNFFKRPGIAWPDFAGPAKGELQSSDRICLASTRIVGLFVREKS
jgi:hypothetical protein